MTQPLLKVCMAEFDIQWQNPIANLAILEETIWDIAQKVDVIVLPELFHCGFGADPAICAETMNGHTHMWMKQIASQHACLVIGSVMIKENSKLHNRLIVQYPDGNFETYDKRHLFPLGNPSEQNCFEAGKKLLICHYKGFNILPNICYDLRFGYDTRNMKHDHTYAYDLFINISNWPASRIKAFDTLLASRAIENQCIAIGVNRIGTDGNHITYTGGSSAYFADGERINPVYSKNNASIIEIYKIKIDNFRSKYPFLENKL